MRQRIGAYSLLLLAVSASGCCSNRYICDDDYFGGALSGRFDQLVEPSAEGDCCDEAPVDWQAYTFTKLLKNRLTCGAGCGPIYWGEWIHDPPDDCDPCDDHGQFIGARLCPPRPLQALWHGLRGQRLCSGCESGCQDCQLLDEPAFDMVPAPKSPPPAATAEPYYEPRAS